MLDVASVGLGWWSDVLASAIAGSEKIRVVSCASRSADKRTAFAAKFGTGTHDSLAAILADPGIDGVLLTTPHSLHGDHVRQAAAAGKHVFVEKPFTLTHADAQSAIAACEAAGVVLAVGHNRRLAPATRAIRRLIDAGDLGTVLHGEAQFSLPSALGYAPEFWRANRAESPGGGLTALGIHMIDALAHLLGPIARVSALSKRQAAPVDIDDTTAALMECTNGRTAYLGCLFATQPTRFLNIYGTKAVARAEDDLTRLALSTGNDPPRLVLTPTADAEQPPWPAGTIREELEAFADAVAGTAPFPIAPSEAAHNVAVMEAIIASAGQGGTPVPVAGVG